MTMKHLGDLVSGLIEELEVYLYDIDPDSMDEVDALPKCLSDEEKTFVLMLRKLLKAAG